MGNTGRQLKAIDVDVLNNIKELHGEVLTLWDVVVKTLQDNDDSKILRMKTVLQSGQDVFMDIEKRLKKIFEEVMTEEQISEHLERTNQQQLALGGKWKSNYYAKLIRECIK